MTLVVGDLGGSACSYDDRVLRPVDEMRLALGDTEMESPLFPDATYDGMFAKKGGGSPQDVEGKAIGLAVAALAGSLWRRFAQMPNSVEDPALKLQWAQRLDAWKALVEGGAQMISQTQVPAMRVLRPTHCDEDHSEYAASRGRCWPDGSW